MGPLTGVNPESVRGKGLGWHKEGRIPRGAIQTPVKITQGVPDKPRIPFCTPSPRSDRLWKTTSFYVCCVAAKTELA